MPHDATRGGKAIAHQGFANVGSPSRATSRQVVKTKARGKACGDAFISLRPRQGGLDTGPWTMSRTTVYAEDNGS
ncbi:hypothetical protein H5410_041064 [Solanum commersonii]|uniref:Uncharacterized protein n=1 Tax=Solanum commersonii TaxID=4109 RepID=A0A9J5XUD6_SOLCO|nr:hypothetical protein H5410_041064 [Solanum commersonii]